MDTNKPYRLAERIMLTPDGDVTLAFDPESLAVHQLNRSLASVARRCDGARSNESIVVEFSEEYDLQLEAAAREVYQALTILREKSLIEVCS